MWIQMKVRRVRIMSDVNEIAEKFNQLTSLISLPAREDEARVLALALASGLNCVLIGSPGTAKSLMIDTLAKMVDAKYFKYLLTKFTEPEEIFGYPDVKTLRETGEIVYNYSNKLPEAEIAFLDEIFKGSSAILNTLLRIINEKEFYDGRQFIRVPLHVLYGASNELPEDESLNALYDRFIIRLFMRSTPSDYYEDVVRKGWSILKNSWTNSGNTIMTMDEVRAFSIAILNVDIDPIVDTMLEVITKFEKTTETTVSDRRKVMALKLIATNALLNGRSQAIKSDVSVLRYILPETPDHMEPVNELLKDYMDAEDRARREARELMTQLNSIIERIEKATSTEELQELVEAVREASVAVSNFLSKYSGLEIEEINEVRALKEKMGNTYGNKLLTFQ